MIRTPWCFLAATSCLTALLAQTEPSRAQPNRNRAWQFFAAQHDKDQDGKVTGIEYSRGADKFVLLDKDRDGVLTANDFATGRDRPTAARDGLQPLRSLVQRAAPGVASITREDWRRIVQRLDKISDGVLTGAELDGVLPGAARTAVLRILEVQELSTNALIGVFDRLDANRNGVLAGTELAAGRPVQSGLPRIGDVAPDFDLPVIGDAERTIRLASYAGKRPVALIFGSYT